MFEIENWNQDHIADEFHGIPVETLKTGPRKGRGEVILAIEDEELLRDLLQTILEESGYRVLLAANGTEGVQIYMKHMDEISLVLLDMGLPKMSGEEVLSRLVSTKLGVKVVSVSGSIEPEVRESAIRSGAVDYLPKPYMMEDILMKVESTLHGTRVS